MKIVVLLDAVHDASTPPAQQLAEHRELLETSVQLGVDAIVCGQHFLGTEMRYYQPVPYLAHLGDARAVRPPRPRDRPAAAPQSRAGGRGRCARSTSSPAAASRSAAAWGTPTASSAPSGSTGADRGGALRGVARPDHAALERRAGDARGAVLPGRRRHASVGAARAAAAAADLDRRAVARLPSAAPPGLPTRGTRRRSPPTPPFAELAGRLRRGARPPRPARGRRVPRPPRAPRRRRRSGRHAPRCSSAAARATPCTSAGASPSTAASSDAGGASLDAETEEEADGRFLLGPAEDCAEGLARLRDEVGMTHFVYKPQWLGLPHVEAMRQLEAFGTGVLPLVRAR